MRTARTTRSDNAIHQCRCFSHGQPVTQLQKIQSACSDTSARRQRILMVLFISQSWQARVYIARFLHVAHAPCALLAMCKFRTPDHSWNMQNVLRRLSSESCHNARNIRPRRDSEWEWRGVTLQNKQCSFSSGGLKAPCSVGEGGVFIQH